MGATGVTNRHINFLGEFDANFSLIHKYDYHQYNVSVSQFGSNLGALQNAIAPAMSPEPRYPTTISEFNAHTAAVFDSTSETLDSPAKYTWLGGIVASLVKKFQDELYCFKFGQTVGDVGDNYPVRKNGIHFVDNTNAPFNIGGITKAGEVYRLFRKSSPTGSDLLATTQGSGATSLHLFSTRDSELKRHHVFSANDTSSVDITLNAMAWSLPEGQRVLLEEVSENIYGGVKALLTMTNHKINAGTHAANTVWLFSVPTQPQEPSQTIFATDDAMVRDGANRTLNFGTNASCVVKNNSTNANERSASFLKFRLPAIYFPDIQFALLTVRASSINGGLAQAHVYGITNNNWSEANITWSNAPGLKQNVAAGANYVNNFIAEQGTGAQMVGQFVADAAPKDRMIDVTRFILENPANDISFLLGREVRFQNDTQDTEGFSIVSKEADTNNGPRLILIRANDSDDDGISDEAELNIFGTNPNSTDTDGDNVSDGEELLVLGTDPGTHIAVAPTISAQPSSMSVAVGETANFGVNAQGTQPLFYQWFFNHTNVIATATNSVFALPNAQANHLGDYHVVISNSAGFVNSSSAHLVVTNRPQTLFNYEDFSYEAESLLAGQGNWLNNGANLVGTIETGNLSVPGLFPASGNRFTWNNPSMSLRLPLGASFVVREIFFSFAMRVDNMGGSFTSVGTLAGFTLGTGSSFVSKINIRPNGAGGFNLGISKAGGTTFGDWATNQFAVGETIFVVGSYRFDVGSSTDDLCDLWLNPGSESFGATIPPTPTLANQGNGGNDLSPIDRFFFRSGGSAASPAKLVADELRIGTTWASVTEPAPVSLRISSSGETVTLSWPTNSPGWKLQSARNLNAPESWSSLTNGNSIADDRFTMTNPISGEARFYRLVK